MPLIVEESAKKHGFTDEEIRYAVFHRTQAIPIKGMLFQ